MLRWYVYTSYKYKIFEGKVIWRKRTFENPCSSSSAFSLYSKIKINKIKKLKQTKIPILTNSITELVIPFL
jgi:hypothetical protein